MSQFITLWSHDGVGYGIPLPYPFMKLSRCHSCNRLFFHVSLTHITLCIFWLCFIWMCFFWLATLKELAQLEIHSHFCQHLTSTIKYFFSFKCQLLDKIGSSQTTILVNLIHLNCCYNEVYYYFVVTASGNSVRVWHYVIISFFEYFYIKYISMICHDFSLFLDIANHWQGCTRHHKASQGKITVSWCAFSQEKNIMPKSLAFESNEKQDLCVFGIHHDGL